MVHGDIRPGNMLFSSDWNLRLSDMDRSTSINSNPEAVSEPFGRLLSREEGKGPGTYAIASVRIEAFAIGSIYYILLRGHEPYETEYWGKEHDVVLMEKFQNREFPALDDSACDTIIRKCRNAEYHSRSELLGEFADDLQDAEASVQAADQVTILRKECEEIARSELLKTLRR